MKIKLIKRLWKTRAGKTIIHTFKRFRKNFILTNRIKRLEVIVAHINHHHDQKIFQLESSITELNSEIYVLNEKLEELKQSNVSKVAKDSDLLGNNHILQEQDLPISNAKEYHLPRIVKPGDQKNEIVDQLNRLKKGKFEPLCRHLLKEISEKQNLNHHSIEDIDIESFVNKKVFLEVQVRLLKECSFSEEKNNVVKALIVRETLKELGICSEIIERLDQLTEESLALIETIVSNNPPGELTFSQQDHAFNPKSHRRAAGSDTNSENIKLTTYPGYKRGNEIVMRATVIT